MMELDRESATNSAQAATEFDAEYDGNSEFTLHLDSKGSTILYLPSIGLPETQLANLEAALAASEATAEQPPPDELRMSPHGRRQWLAIPPDRPLGWEGPRRWERASWKLHGETQLQPILAIRDAVESAVAAFDARPTEGSAIDALDANSILDLRRPRIQESYNTVLVNRYLDGAASIKWHSDDEKWYHCDGREDMIIGSVSLGAARWFELRTAKQKGRVPKNLRRRVRVRLKPGSLLVMAGMTQQHWEHALPVDPSCASVRYNLTFRRAATASDAPALANPKEQQPRDASGS